MKKRNLLIPIFLLLFLLAGCAKKNTLLAGAAPEISALSLFHYDGETITRQLLFDAAQEQKLLDALARVPAKQDASWLPTQATAPIWAFEISNKDGESLYGAWSDGHWITSDGAVYTFDFDFAALQSAYDWDADTTDTFSDFSVLPCARVMTRGEDGWHAELLTPAAPLTPPEGISMTLTEFLLPGKLTVELVNNSEEEWSYGKYFSVQALLDGVWYNIPPVPGAWGFEDIAMLLPAGKTAEESYMLAMYGNLPAGTYRLVVEGLSAEFTIE